MLDNFQYSCCNARVYALVLQGNNTSGIKTENLITMNAGTPAAVTNSTPANGANNVAVPTTLTWSASASSPVTYTVIFIQILSLP